MDAEDGIFAVLMSIAFAAMVLVFVLAVTHDSNITKLNNNFRNHCVTDLKGEAQIGDKNLCISKEGTILDWER